MLPAAIGAFHEHQVGPLHDGRIAQYGCVVLAQIAGEDQRAPHVSFFQLHFYAGRAHDVAGIMERHAHTRCDFLGCGVGHAAQLGAGHIRVGHVVQWLDRRAPLAGPLAVLPLRVPLGQAGRIAQHDLTQIRRRPVGQHWPRKPAFHQQR